MDGSILLSILAFSFSCGAICASSFGYFYLKYLIKNISRDNEHNLELKLREQAEYLRQQAQDDAFQIMKEYVPMQIDNQDSLALGNFNNFGL